MSELSPSGGSEGYGTCDDEVHKCALSIITKGTETLFRENLESVSIPFHQAPNVTSIFMKLRYN